MLVEAVEGVALGCDGVAVGVEFGQTDLPGSAARRRDAPPATPPFSDQVMASALWDGHAGDSLISLGTYQLMSGEANGECSIIGVSPAMSMGPC